MFSLYQRLPFDIGDFEAVGQLARRCLEKRDPEAKELLQVWTYAFLRRYYAQKFYQQLFQLPKEVEDLISKTFLRVWRSVHQLQEPEKFPGWVVRISSRELSTYFRKKKRVLSHGEVSIEESVEIPDPTPEPSPLERMDVLIYREVLERAIARLPDYLQEVVYLRYFEGFSTPEIAERMEKSQATIRSYLQRARRKLEHDPEVKNLLIELEK